MLLIPKLSTIHKSTARFRPARMPQAPDHTQPRSSYTYSTTKLRLTTQHYDSLLSCHGPNLQRNYSLQKSAFHIDPKRGMTPIFWRYHSSVGAATPHDDGDNGADDIPFTTDYTKSPVRHDHDTSTAFASSNQPKKVDVPLDDQLALLHSHLTKLEHEIMQLNDGVKLNLNSYKQISMALFGTPDQSTSKPALEGMAAHNRLASLILDHRQVKQTQQRLIKQSKVSATRMLQQRSKQQKQQKQQKQTKSQRSNDTQTISRVTDLANNGDSLMLVDTSSFIFRAYYSMPPMHRFDGMPVSAVLGFCNMLNRLVLKQMLQGHQPRLVLCCDASGKTFRHATYKDYKANRQEVPMDLIPQFDLIRQAAKAYGMLWIQAPGYEADDVIATLSQKASQEGVNVQIYSGDKDLMQLITKDDNDNDDEEGKDNGYNSFKDKNSKPPGTIEMVDPLTLIEWNHDKVVEKWGVSAKQLGDVLALAGDTADNVPGVPGIGPKIAAALIQQFGTLDNLLNNLDQVSQTKRREKLETYRDQAKLSQELVRLHQDLDWEAMEVDPNNILQSSKPTLATELRMEAMNPHRILDFYDQMGFVTIKNRLLEQLQRNDTKVAFNRVADDHQLSNNKKKNSFEPRPKVQVPEPKDYDDVPF